MSKEVNFTITELSNLVDRAIADLSSRGVENAWEHQDGTVLRWDWIQEVMYQIVTKQNYDNGIFDDTIEDTITGTLVEYSNSNADGNA